MLKILFLLGFTPFLMSNVFAQTSNTVVGTWKLLAYEVEAQSNGERGPIMGAKPTGFVTFTPEGRVAFVLTGEARKAGKTDAEKAELLNTIVAYAGSYTTEGETWATQVDVAWNPEWVGSKQVRNYKVEDNRLVVTTPWRVMPNWADKGVTRSIVTFERSK